jgi:transposase
MIPTDPSQLPDDVDVLKAMLVALMEQQAAGQGTLTAMVAQTSAQRATIETQRTETANLESLRKQANERIDRLTSILKMIPRALYGTRSEKLRMDRLDDEQMTFVFDEIETGMGEIEAGLDVVRQRIGTLRPARPRKGFAPHLERVEVVIEPDEPVDCAGLEKARIGEEVSERLDVTPAKFQVIIIRRPKYAYRLADGEDRIVQAPAPDHIIAGGIPTEALLAQVAVSKYADGLPLYRQEGIYARDGVELDRSLMAQWMGKLGFELEPLAQYVLHTIEQDERIFADETRLPTLAPGNGKVKTAWLWAYLWTASFLQVRFCVLASFRLQLSIRSLMQLFRPGPSARCRMEGRRWLRDRLAVSAGELLAHRLDHLPLARNLLQRLGDVLAHLDDAVGTAAGAARGGGDDHTLTGQMVGEWLACRTATLESGNARGFSGGAFGGNLVLGGGSLEIIELQLHLVDQQGAALGAAAILLPAQFGDCGSA